MNKSHLVWSVLLLSACGGGSSESNESSQGNTPSPTQSVDYEISTNHLIKYESGHSIRYTGTVDGHQATLTRLFDYSTNTITFQSPTGELADSLRMIDEISLDNSTTRIESEIFQFTDATPSYDHTLITYYEYVGGGYVCPLVTNDNTCVGRVDIPSPLELGAEFSYSGYQSIGSTYFGVSDFSSKDWSLEQTIKITAIETVETEVGTFDSYKLVVERTLDARADSVGDYSFNGTFWVHPEVGIIKAEFDEVVDQEKSESSLIMTWTNIDL